jgi:hypothetical protein
MNSRSFSLQPFPIGGPPPLLQITGHVSRRGQTTTIHYELRDELAAVAMPLPADAPARRHGLWEETCFEFFLGTKNSPQYWEFNLSPAGPWNVYHFADYRQGMAEEVAFASLPFSVQRQPDSWLLTLEVDLTKIIPADQTLEIGISAVIKLREGEATYWALSHPGPQADFHRRDAFICQLDPEN